MAIFYSEKNKTFHLTNGYISYIFKVMRNNQLGQLYFGKAIRNKEDFSYLLETASRPMTSYVYEGDRTFSLEHIKQEYPSYGTTDYRQPALEVKQENGSIYSNFTYVSHKIFSGKPKLSGLPATYTENDNEAETLEITLCDKLTNIKLQLLYTIFAKGGAIARSAKFTNESKTPVHLTKAMSMCLDLPDYNYEWLQFSGAWSRERHIKIRNLEQGTVSIGSMRGNSSHEHNPFVVLKRLTADEFQGEVIGISLIYSGNFIMQAEVDAHNLTRVLAGINPENFDWKLDERESFQTPEAVIVYSDKGLNGMSQTFHKLYQKRLARGYWRDRPCPILINNWEATYFDFDEDKIVEIAKAAKNDGVELFVLDDGWFGKRNNDSAGLGDWTPNFNKLKNGITGLADKIEALGMKFGLWFEPEMVNKDSELYRKHPEWILQIPGRSTSHGRFQHVLDFARKEVVDCVYEMMAKILREAKVSYIKWDMNRSITECYSTAFPADRQGEIFHRYILGMYDLYERLIDEFPHILFESCASGGGRFDAGMLYYAPQAWTSDDSDAIERLKIQYGTSLCYPISSMGTHVSVVPNHQINRITPLHTRANVAYFGSFGYELDLNKLTQEERVEVRKQIRFMKEYRQLLQYGTFYRLQSPFDSNVTAWMVVSEDKRTAIVGWYRILNQINGSFERIRLKGLDENLCYSNSISGIYSYGDELMNLGLITTDSTAGEIGGDIKPSCDFDSKLYILKAK